MLRSVSARAADANLTLGQVAAESRPNEPPAIPKPLSLLSLEGALVTMGAGGGCQKEVARAATGAKADYLLVAKGNQERLTRGVPEPSAQAEAVGYQGVGHGEYGADDDGRGRAEERSCAVPYGLGKTRDEGGRPGLSAIGPRCSEGATKGGTSGEARLFVGGKKGGPSSTGTGHGTTGGSRAIAIGNRT